MAFVEVAIQVHVRIIKCLYFQFFVTPKNMYTYVGLIFQTCSSLKLYEKLAFSISVKKPVWLITFALPFWKASTNILIIFWQTMKPVQPEGSTAASYNIKSNLSLPFHFLFHNDIISLSAAGSLILDGVDVTEYPVFNDAKV